MPKYPTGLRYSIIMPVYMTEKSHLSVVLKAVESIRKHSKDYELIVIDDGSAHRKLLRDEIEPYTDKYVTHQKNMGIARSWNGGLWLAKGEYVCIVNDDIEVLNDNWLTKMRQALEQEDEYKVSAPGVEGENQGKGGIIEDYVWFPGFCFMLARETIDEIGYFDEKFNPFNYEDTDYWTRILKDGGKLVRNYNTTIKHVGGSVLHTLDYNRISEENHSKFIDKWKFDPLPIFCFNETFNFKSL